MRTLDLSGPRAGKPPVPSRGNGLMNSHQQSWWINTELKPPPLFDFGVHERKGVAG